MINAADILEKISADFGAKSSEVFSLFDESILKSDYLNDLRIIRCIIFLSYKNIDRLKANIEAARQDPRDVMLWAEYVNFGQDDVVKRVRDFNLPFAENEPGLDSTNRNPSN